MSVARGWQFFMHPGPTNIPHRVLQAMQRPAVDFTGPEFVALRDRSLERLKGVLKTKQGFDIDRTVPGIAVASVVPRLRAALREMTEKWFPVKTVSKQGKWSEEFRHVIFTTQSPFLFELPRRLDWANPSAETQH